MNFENEFVKFASGAPNHFLPGISWATLLTTKEVDAGPLFLNFVRFGRLGFEAGFVGFVALPFLPGISWASLLTTAATTGG